MEIKEIKEAKEILDSHIEETSEDELSSVDIAEHLKTLKRHNEEEYVEYLEKLDPESLANAAIEMPDHMLKDVIDTLSTDKIVEAIEELESDDQTDLLRNIGDIDEDKAKELFCELDLDDQKDILKLSTYDDDVAGAYMQTELFSAKTTQTLQEAVETLRILKRDEEIENVYKLFVVDEENRLKNTIALSDLLFYDFSLTMQEIVDSKFSDSFKARCALDTDKIEDVAIEFQEFDLSVMPIIDKDGVLLGRITTDDIHDFIQDSATEQIYSLVGVDDEAEEEDDTMYTAGRARARWLLVNFATAMVIANVISLFESTLQAYVALAFLMPIVASMGGNTGMQSLTVTVRKLSLGEISSKDVGYVLRREIGISIINGLIFAAIVGTISSLWFHDYMLGVVIGMAMIINFFCAGLVGTIIPLTLKKFGIDPATGSSVLLTMVTDVVGFFSFLGLATWILL